MSWTWCQFLFSSALVLEEQQHRQWRSGSWSAGDPRSPTWRVLEITDSHQSTPVLKVQYLPREGCSLRCLHKKRTSTVSCPGRNMLDIAMSLKKKKKKHFTPTRMVITKGWTITVGTLLCALWECKTEGHCGKEFNSSSKS